MEEEKHHIDFMESMKQYDPDPSADDDNAKNKPPDDPVVDLFPDDDRDDRNSKCMFAFLLLVVKHLLLEFLLKSVWMKRWDFTEIVL